MSVYFPFAIIIVGAYTIIYSKQRSVQMKLMLVCFFLGLYAQFGQSWYFGYSESGLSDFGPYHPMEVKLTRIMLGTGSLCALLCVNLDKWSHNLARVAGGLTLIAPIFWYISVRMDAEYLDYSGYLGITPKIAILGGLLGLLSAKKNYVNMTEVGLGLSNIFRNKKGQRYAEFSIVIILFSLFMPYFNVLGYTISGGDLLLSGSDYLFLLILEFLRENIQNNFFNQWVTFPIQDLLVGQPHVFVPIDGIPSLDDLWGMSSGLVKVLTIVLLMSPLFFSLSALFAAFSLYKEGSVNEKIASTHLTYFFLIIMGLAFASSEYEHLIGLYGSFFTFGGYLGFGFWIGGLAGLGFIRHDGIKQLVLGEDE